MWRAMNVIRPSPFFVYHRSTDPKFWYLQKKYNYVVKRGEEQNREEGEMAQKKLGGERNTGKK